MEYKSKQKVVRTSARESEKELLYKIASAIANVKDRNSLMKLIFEEIKSIFNFYDVGLAVLDADGIYCTDWSALTPDIDPSDTNYTLHNLGLFKHPFKNALFEKLIAEVELAGHPVICKFNQQLVNDNPRLKELLEVEISYGYKECLVTYLKSGNKTIGTLNINSLTDDFFKPTQFYLFQAVADLIAVAVANILANEELLQREREKELLYKIASAIANVKDRNSLMKLILEEIKTIFNFYDVGLAVLDADGFSCTDWSSHTPDIDPSDTNYALHNLGLTKIPFKNSLFEKSIAEVKLAGHPLIYKFNQQLVNANPDLKKLLEVEISYGYKECLFTYLKSGNKIIGSFNINSLIDDFFKPTQFYIFQAVADLVAVAVANIIANEEILQREKEKSLLLNISQKLSNAKKIDELLQIILNEVKPIFNFYDTGILLIDKPTNSFYDLSVINPHIDGSEVNHLLHNKKYYEGNYLPLKNAAVEQLIRQLANESPIIFDYRLNYSSFSDGELLSQLKKSGYIQAWACPLLQQGKIMGVLTLNYNQEHQIPSGKQSLFLALADRIASSITNILATEEILLREKEIATLNKQLQAQNEYLIEEVEEVYNFDEMIGQNNNFRDACKNIGLVAKTDSSVLILGETGTGKELVARAIHNYSPRKNKPLIKLNCAALPANLIESELFGHERGAFTGAIERRIGKFELANGSTLFLDEIGELPLELQAKLLRALQEKEVERLGSNKVIPINVRIIAATNRDLMKEVQTGKFRQDLYYRLHIFPITLPPLRERKEDIPLLAAHFIKKYAKKIGKNIQGLNHTAMQEMVRYNWPGNIRELEHVIERTIILAKSKLIHELDLPVASKSKITVGAEEFVVKPWLQQERDYILSVLKVTNGNVKGKGGAAELLELPPTTLQSKMDKLGIKRKHYIEA